MAIPNQTIPFVAASSTKYETKNNATQNTELSLGVYQTRLTSAMLLALRATPQAVVPASVMITGSGECLYLYNVGLKYTFNTTAYTLNAGTLKLFYGTTANALALTADLTTSFLTAAASRIIPQVPLLKIGPDTFTHIQGAAIFAGNDGGAEFTLGDAVVDVTCIYGRCNY